MLVDCAASVETQTSAMTKLRASLALGLIAAVLSACGSNDSATDNTIRAKAPNNVIIVPSMSWCQKPGDATASPPTGTNLMYTAHIYPGNWKQTFQNQVAAAVGRAPVFITEWGYIISNQTGVPYTTSTTWGTSLRSVVDGNGASWIAWVTDNAWTPNMFTDTALTQLTDFGTLTKTWLAATNSN